MDVKKVKKIANDLNIDKIDIAIDLGSGVAGSAAGYATKSLLDVIIPVDSGNILIDTSLIFGKYCLSTYVGYKVAEGFWKEAHAYRKVYQDYYEWFMNELNDSVYVDSTVEEV